jgi:hypothetical protein
MLGHCGSQVFKVFQFFFIAWSVAIYGYVEGSVLDHIRK